MPDLPFFETQAAVAHVSVLVRFVDFDRDLPEGVVSVVVTLSEGAPEDPLHILRIADIADSVGVAVGLIGIGGTDAVIGVVRDTVVVEVVLGVAAERSASSPTSSEPGLQEVVQSCRSARRSPYKRRGLRTSMRRRRGLGTIAPARPQP